MIDKVLISPLLSEQQCIDSATSADLAFAAGLSPQRRLETLSWRVVLYKHLRQQVDIGYDENGAPIINGSNLHIGVSHTVDKVAVIVSHNRCAVDIERIDRDVERVSDRFMTDKEREIATTPIKRLTMWCAKECYYKLHSARRLKILSQIELLDLDMENGRVVVCDVEGIQEELKLLIDGEHIIVYAL